MTQKFLTWWLIFSTQVVLINLALFLFPGFQFLIENDITYISFIILVVFLFASLFVGWKVYTKSDQFEGPWFSAESCMTLGMIGTVIGFIYMLSNNFADIDPQNITIMKKVIGDMAQGMGTALLTTLVGLISSLCVKVQIIVAEYKK